MSAPPRRPRIAVSGAAGTGKTTLAMALAEALEVPYLAEGMRTRLEQGLDLHDLTRDSHRALHFELLDEMSGAMNDAISAAGGFSCDRSPLDLAAFWLYYGFGFDEADTDAYVARTADAARSLDCIVVMPLGAFAIEDDGVRTANRWVQTHYAAVLEHFLNHSDVPLLRLSPQSNGKQWLREVIAHCGQVCR